jgi:hypothetical protein
LPEEVESCLQETRDHIRAFQSAGSALKIKVRSQDPLQLAIEGPALDKFTRKFGTRTPVIPASREKAFRERFKEPDYLLA